MATPHTRLRDALPRAGEVALLCAARGLASWYVLWSGFRALSDDDYARISIAQGFAESARFDPSHTSWLPAPFWAYGAAFHVFGTGMPVARATALALSAAATLLVYVAARLLGACRPGAVLGATLSTFLPYSALLGVATVPEVPCAALLLFGAATLAHPSSRIRALGGVALMSACLSRYEAWPVALAFAVFSLWDARKDVKLATGATLALLGPALWLVTGKVEHGSAFFFITRVASYRRAIGARAVGSIGQQLLEYPRLLLCAEPELCGLFLIVGALAGRVADRQKFQSFERAGLSLFALLAFMVIGSVRDGVPTHHAARVLLPLWFFGCVFAGHGLTQVLARTSGAGRVGLVALSAAALLIGLLMRSRLLPAEGFADRHLELQAGIEAKRRRVPRLVIDTPDYGYLAVQAAFGSPSRSGALDDHDPRHARPDDPFLSAASLDRALRARGSRFLVATREHAAIARAACAERWQNAGFTLFECPSGVAPDSASP